MADPDEHIQFVFKSSPYGSISHSHGDQNAFCLSAYGEDMAIQSGHYIAFNSSMHQKWRRQTLSKNAILINGKGQYADKDKAKALAAQGRIIAAQQHDDHYFIHGDATAAYQSLSPEVTNAEREIYFVRNSYFVIVDKVDADTPVTIDWLLHANNPFELGKSSFRNTQSKSTPQRPATASPRFWSPTNWMRPNASSISWTIRAMTQTCTSPTPTRTRSRS